MPCAFVVASVDAGGWVLVQAVLKHAETNRMALSVSGLQSAEQPSASSDPTPATSERCPEGQGRVSFTLGGHDSARIIMSFGVEDPGLKANRRLVVRI